MSGHDHEHSRGHLDDPAHPYNAPLSEIQLRVRALESPLTERGLVDPAAPDELIDTYETEIGPRNGDPVPSTLPNLTGICGSQSKLPLAVSGLSS